MKKVVIIDGQGGKIGSVIIEKLRAKSTNHKIYAVGTNSIATAAMLKAGADFGATGENPVVVNSKNADVIVGPLGIVVADSLLGEITAKMSVAIGKSNAKKILLPTNRCNNIVVGTVQMPFSEIIELTVQQIIEACE